MDRWERSTPPEGFRMEGSDLSTARSTLLAAFCTLRPCASVLLRLRFLRGTGLSIRTSCGFRPEARTCPPCWPPSARCAPAPLCSCDSGSCVAQGCHHKPACAAHKPERFTLEDIKRSTLLIAFCTMRLSGPCIAGVLS